MPDSTYLSNKLIDHVNGKTSFTMPVNNYLALFTTPPLNAGSGTEVSGGSYARKQTVAGDWTAASSKQTSNANALAFPQATADWAPIATPVIAFAKFDASSSGNMLDWDYLGGFDYQPFSTVDAAGDTLQCPSHGLLANDPVIVTAEFGGALPAGLSADTVYYVRSGGLTTDALTLAATLGGSAVNITGNGMGMIRKIQQKVIQNGDTPSFAAGAFTIKRR